MPILYVHPTFTSIVATTTPAANFGKKTLRFGTLKESGSNNEDEIIEVLNGEEEEAVSIIDMVNEVAEPVNVQPVQIIGELQEEEGGEEAEPSEQDQRDAEFMLEAINEAKHIGGGSEREGPMSPFPRPIAGAVLVNHKTNRILARGYSDCLEDCVPKCLTDAGLTVTPLREWAIGYPTRELQDVLHNDATLYLTLEPSAERNGSLMPSITRLIEDAGVHRVVVGAMDPIPELQSKGCSALHAAGVHVDVLPSGSDVEQQCQQLIAGYSARVNTKLHRRSRRHFAKKGRPLGFLHCSVIDSNDAEAFERSGNAFPRDLGGAVPLSERNYGSYEIAPPPEQIWASNSGGGSSQASLPMEEEEEEEDNDSLLTDFEDEEVSNNTKNLQLSSPMMPWYEQVDAVVATFPKPGNGPANDDSLAGRLTGLKWLATNGKALPAGVERILVMDAADLIHLPLKNDDANLNGDVDVEGFWKGEGRKPSRILLRHGTNAAAASAARTAATAAAMAASAAKRAMQLAESGEAEGAAKEAILSQEAAENALNEIQQQVDEIQALKQYLIDLGVVVETIQGGRGSEPIDIMAHLGERSGYKAVVWRAGCWGSRGVASILNGAFQWVSAHLAVDAGGGKFWQLMLAERCIQAACGPESKVKVMTEENDISIEYCDDADADKDCVLQVGGRSIRHVRVDCRVAVVNPDRKRELIGWRTTRPMPVKPFHEEEAPWFL
eukprot:CAMPEP_0196818200 /NCGR_PEP_ID=MMETSP1362-20130617/64441_1 /TAXON_ID=163516 /ORGANISM="Leptocylindrus danicus, Strain CCMP1856" /LENGTH=721 /DNA_ID=CAMNT_0042196187 /DNA_START=438 /DNA_END=2604 /DNA_ORIENTATION=-